MGLQQFILAFMSAGLLFFAIYYLFAVAFIHKKLFDKYFFFVIACLSCSVFAFFQLLLSLDFSDKEYIVFHNMKGLCIFFIAPAFFSVIYDCFFKGTKKILPNIFLSLIPLNVLIVILNSFVTYPVTSYNVETPFATFVSHSGTPKWGYLVWSYPSFILLVSMLLQYIFSKNKEKKFPFFVILLVSLLILLNDSFVSRGLIHNIYMAEDAFFCMIAFVFIDFLKEDRKAYLSVVDLSKELMKHKEELEIMVEERTRELQQEKEKSDELLKKSEQLLLNILPDEIAERLKLGEQPIADHFDDASVIFIDIVDFTKLSAKSTPQKMVSMLNHIFTQFDKIAARHGLEKIKTIGDCYMAAAGIPVPRDDHAEAIANMAIEAMDTMNGYITEEGYEIQFRVGLDCGPIVAGVIGEQKFIYDLWGDMVNTASRMETNGIIGKIQCTERFVDKLRLKNGNLKIQFEERGEIEVKGKGMMKTYLLN